MEHCHNNYPHEISPLKPTALSSHVNLPSRGVCSWVGRRRGAGEIFGGRSIRWLEDTGDEGAGFVELAGVAGDVGRVRAISAPAGARAKAGFHRAAARVDCRRALR